MQESSETPAVRALEGLPLSTFWGACLRPGKLIKVTVPSDAVLHITQITLGPDAAAGRNVVVCRHGDDEDMSETALCVLAAGRTECFQYQTIIT